jgi:hypothetical protein
LTRPSRLVAAARAPGQTAALLKEVWRSSWQACHAGSTRSSCLTCRISYTLAGLLRSMTVRVHRSGGRTSTAARRAAEVVARRTLGRQQTDTRCHRRGGRWRWRVCIASRWEHRRGPPSERALRKATEDTTESSHVARTLENCARHRVCCGDYVDGRGIAGRTSSGLDGKGDIRGGRSCPKDPRLASQVPIRQAWEVEGGVAPTRPRRNLPVCTPVEGRATV